MIFEITIEATKGAKKLDEEDLANLLDEIESIDKGKHYIM